jgi:hypothetical protein
MGPLTTEEETEAEELRQERVATGVPPPGGDWRYSRDQSRASLAGFPQVCAKLHIRNAEPVVLTARFAVKPPASSSSMNRVSAFC